MDTVMASPGAPPPSRLPRSVSPPHPASLRRRAPSRLLMWCAAPRLRGPTDRSKWDGHGDGLPRRAAAVRHARLRRRQPLRRAPLWQHAVLVGQGRGRAARTRRRGGPARAHGAEQLRRARDHAGHLRRGSHHRLLPGRAAGYSWGWGDFGRLGHGNSSDVFTPQPVKALQGLKIKQIACGDSHCLAVTMDGDVHSWGRNQNGQLGLGTTEDSLLPQKVQAFEGVYVKMIAAGAEHTAAVTEDGDLYGWGWGRYGNLGLGDRNDRPVPEKVSSVEEDKVVLVACGWRHTITVSSSGTLYTYGWSKYGQLGHGDFEDHLIPYKVEALKDSTISQISGGWRHTMALTSEGKLYGWGWNKFGQVGAGDNDDHCSPVQVHLPEEQKVCQVACGWRHTLALIEKKNVFSWGRGTSGQLGHGEIVDRNTPTIVDAISPDGPGCKKLESSKAIPFAAKVWVSPSERYALVPDENVPKSDEDAARGRADVNVPENDLKRMRVQS